MMNYLPGAAAIEGSLIAAFPGSFPHVFGGAEFCQGDSDTFLLQS